MKRKCIFLLVMMLLVSAGALAQNTGVKAPAKKEPLDIWNVDFDDLDDEDRERIERYKEEAALDAQEKLRNAAVPKEKDYDSNTVCSFGPQFREVSRRLTDKWYMFTPLDLSKDGVQKYDLIGGGMYVIGEVTVTVKDGMVTVDYRYADRSIQGGREYFSFFADFESVEESALENFHMQKHYTYGRPYSIEKTLGGDTDVLLFVCNTATFQKTASGVTRYYSTHPDREAMRETMLDMIGK